MDLGSLFRKTFVVRFLPGARAGPLFENRARSSAAATHTSPSARNASPKTDRVEYAYDGS